MLITINTGGEAFKPDPRREVSRILSELSDRVSTEGLTDPCRLVIRDVNGGRVGLLEYRKENHA